MDIEKAISFIESSFLKDLLNLTDVTDISYNGKSIFYMSNTYGRKKASIEVDYSTVKDFLRQIANITEKQFSFQNPNLDVSIGKYRLNATHQSIARKDNQEALNFSIRIAGSEEIINDSSKFVPPELQALFSLFLEEKMSLVIGGETGSGKTELQKYLIKKMKKNTRIIIIDNVLELGNVPDSGELDINIWQSDNRYKEMTTQNLVKNALRCNPDWLIVAESRAEEMIDALNSAMTGHPIITTIHAFDIDSIPHRIGRMIMMNEKKMDFEGVMNDVYYHFRIFIYLKVNQTSSGEIKRFISDVAYFDQKGKKHNIFTSRNGIEGYSPLPKEFLLLLKQENLNKVPKVFLRN